MMAENTETIRDIAVKLLENKIKSEETYGENSSRTIFILGQNNCGKSSLINHFLDKNEKPKETLGLEYTFGRKNLVGQFGDKNICHIWELGGDISLSTSDLMSIPLSAHCKCGPAIPSQLTILFMVDLSQPRTIFFTLNNCFSRLSAALRSLSDRDGDTRHPVRRESGSSFQHTHAERSPLPLPLCPILIVGGKYDLFRELDSSYKMTTIKTLLSAAHYFGTGMFFYSNSDQSLSKKSKESLNYIGLGIGNPIKSFIQDMDRPMQIRPGDEFWLKSSGLDIPPWEKWGTQVTGAGGTGVMAESDRDRPACSASDPSLEPAYREPAIDTLRAQRDKELTLIMNIAGKQYH